MNTGRAIRVLRAARGLQQRDLARRAGLDPSYVSLIESGKREPSESAIEAIASALKAPVSLVELLAAEAEELRGIGPAQARQLGLALARAMAESS